MSEAESRFNILRQSADSAAVAAIERLVGEAPDRDLNRVNVLDFAAKHRISEERAIGAFLHAARLGLFEMSWNLLCPGCGGVLDANATLNAAGLTPLPQRCSLRGIAEQFMVYEIP